MKKQLFVLLLLSSFTWVRAQQGVDLTPETAKEIKYKMLKTAASGGFYVIKEKNYKNNWLLYYDGRQWKDLTPNSNGWEGVYAYDVDPGGTVYCFARTSGDASRVFRYRNNRWDTLPLQALNGKVLSLWIAPDGRLLLRGKFNNEKGSYYLAAWQQEQWEPVGQPVNHRFLSQAFEKGLGSAFATDGAGNLYVDVFVYDSNPSRSYVARWDGKKWSLLDSDKYPLTTTINNLVADKNGTVYLGGSFKDASGKYCVPVWENNRWNTYATDDIINDIALDESGRLLIGGWFKEKGNYAVRVWDRNGWSAYAYSDVFIQKITPAKGFLYATVNVGEALIYKLVPGGLTVQGPKATGNAAPPDATVKTPRYRKVESNYGNKRFLLFKDDKSKKEWGLMNSSGLVLLEQQYTAISVDMLNNYGIAAIKRMNETSYSVIDSTCKTILQGLENVMNFYNGLAPVKQNGKWGYMNKMAVITIPCEFMDYKLFYEGIVFVSKHDQVTGKISYGAIDSTGKAVISFSYAGLDGFIAGKAIFKDHATGKWGIMDSREKVVLAPAYDSLRIEFDYIIAGNAGKYGVLDSLGKVKVALKYDELETLLSTPNIAHVKLGNKQGLVNLLTGAPIGVMYDEVRSFTSGLALVKQNGKYGFINTSGKLVIPAIYEEARIFFDSGDTDQTKVKLNGKVIIIDKTGKKIRDTNLTTVYDN